MLLFRIALINVPLLVTDASLPVERANKLYTSNTRTTLTYCYPHYKGKVHYALSFYLTHPSHLY